MAYLTEWAARPDRKPLVIRGARQVGKSYLVNSLGATYSCTTVVDFERNPDDRQIFESRDPRKVLALLEIRAGRRLEPGKSLLFLDEIQAAPEVFAALRYFREELPEQHVIAAGSLLDFALEDPAYSMPVGRVEFLHLGPCEFEEFVGAVYGSARREFLEEYRLGDVIPASLHKQFSRYVREFMVVGGMPEAVDRFSASQSYIEVERIQQSLLSTYRADFSKYAERVPATRLDTLFTRLPHLVGRKFKYVQVDPDERARDLRIALRKLELARVAYRVQHSSASGVPLAAQAKGRHFKALFVDVGLLAAATGIRATDLELAASLLLVNSGAIAEQFVGQHLLYSRPYYLDPQLHYWIRQKRGAAAEVDYVIELDSLVVPIEVKAGATGGLKSLRVFVEEKRCPLAVRFNTEPPSIHDMSIPRPGETAVQCRLLSLPLYLVGQVRRLCTSAAPPSGAPPRCI